MGILFALGVADFGVLVVYLAAMVGIGAYFSREQRSNKDYFLAGRSMGWFPVGISAVATLLSALSYSGNPGEAYYSGLKYLVSLLAFWLTVPVLNGYILPLYERLQLYSVYEYLELRFDLPTRVAGSVLFLLWRMLWLGGVLYAPCKILVVLAGLQVPLWLLVVVLGLVTTYYTFLGGMKAVIWTDVIQAFVMIAGLAPIVVIVWWSLPGGAGEVWDVAQRLGRDQLADWSFTWTDPWSFWVILPHLVLAMLSFYIADQITAQRFLTARDLKSARQSFLINCVGMSVIVSALMYVGLCLLAFYQTHPQQMRPIWVANVDSVTRRSAVDPASPQQPLLDWNSDRLDATTIESLVAQRRVLRPDTAEPFTNAAVLVDSNTGRLNVEMLAARRGGEIILNRRAQDELMPRFIAEQLPVGFAGLVMAGLFAASMSSISSGLNSTCTLLIIDFHRRLGWGLKWLAARRGKSPEQLDESDELYLSRRLVLGLGVVATAFSLVVSRIENFFDIMIAVVNTFGGPLLAVFLLGIFTRRTTSRAALLCLVAGTLMIIWLMASNTYDALAWMWPFRQRLASPWTLVLSVGVTIALGYVSSFWLGKPKSPQALRGLVVGCGELGRTESTRGSASPDQKG